MNYGYHSCSDMIVDLHPNKAASEERFDPSNDVRGKSLVLKDVNETSVVDMVKEALDVHHKEGRDQVLLSCGLDVVGEGEPCCRVRGL